MRKANLAAFIALLILSMTWFSAATAQDATPEPSPQSPDATAEATADAVAMPEGDLTFVRFAHFSPDAGDVDIYVDGEISEAQSLTFPNVSEWMALPSGDHDFAVVPAGSDLGSAVLTTDTVNLPVGNWATIAVVGSATNGTLAPIVAQEVIQPLADVLPGTATYTFMNALGDGTSINFLRDDIPYVTALGSQEKQQAFSTITDDSGQHSFAATMTENDQVITKGERTDLRETSSFLIVLVGGDTPQLLVFETPRADLEIVQGNLQAPGTLVDVAHGQENLQAFGALIDQAGLTEMLSGEGPYTIFVPADFNLDDIPAGTDLNALLLNHIVEGDLKSMQVQNAGTLTTLGGQQLTVAIEGDSVTVNGNQIIVFNIPATNGTIHIINGMLTPQ